MHASPPRLVPVPSSPRPLRVGLLGIGVVGSGTHRVLQRNRELIRARAGREIELRMVAARDVARARRLVDPAIDVVGDAMQLVRDPQLDVVVEVIGGCTAARTLVMEAIAHGKHVVTANKALLAEHGREIFAAARARQVIVAFEGAVAVSIPIVKALREGLAGNRIDWVAGIVNGTTNFILSRMRDQGVPFADALREAQRLGYAEADPRFDVEGIDAAHKLALLASMAFGMPLSFDAMRVQGISSLDPADFRHAERLGYRIKLVAIARRQGDAVDLRVEPALVPQSSLLAHVDGSMNGILVKSDAAGLTMYYGAGAGSEQTASAVIADLVDVARQAGLPAHQRVPALAFHEAAEEPLQVLPADEAITRHYLRLSVDNQTAWATVLDAVAANGIAVDDRLELTDERGRQFVIVTQEASAHQLRSALARLALPTVHWRVEGLS